MLLDRAVKAIRHVNTLSNLIHNLRTPVAVIDGSIR